MIIGIATYAMDIMLKVDSLPGEDGFAVISDTARLPGGSGTNVLVQASRLGAECGFIGKLGDDAVGSDIVRDLRNEKIDISGIVTKKNGTSLHTTIVVDREGRKFILLNMGDSFLELNADEINWNFLDKQNIYFTDLLPYPAAAEGLRKAKQAGMKTAVNLQVGLPTMNGFGVTKEMILQSLSMVDIFAPCRGGLSDICGTSDPDACFAYLKPYFHGTLVLTLGTQGSVAFDEQGRRFSQPIRRVQAVDTTGAGDSFLGAFLVAHLLQKMPLQNALRYATVCSSVTCSRLGARSGPDDATVREILSREEL